MMTNLSHPQRALGKKAVCLFSGGLDSSTCLYMALRQGYEVFALTVDYGQLHHKEIYAAESLAQDLGIEYHILPVSFPWRGSALLSSEVDVPENRALEAMRTDIPATYVPARNMVLLSLAASYAEAKSAQSIWIGANAVDYSGYPDCRPDFIKSFGRTMLMGTKTGRQGAELRIEAPLLRLSKRAIIILAQALGVPFEKTWSCYRGGDRPCGKCDACQLRQKGFEEAGVLDPLMKDAISSHA